MVRLNDLPRDLMLKIKVLLDPASRAKLDMVDKECRGCANAHDQELGAHGQIYFKDALHSEWQPAAQQPNAAQLPPLQGPELSAVQQYKIRQMGSYTALQAVRASGFNLYNFAQQVAMHHQTMSSRYAYLPAAEHGIELLRNAATPPQHGYSPPRISGEIYLHTVKTITALIEASNAPAGERAAEAKKRLNEVPRPPSYIPRRQQAPDAPRRQMLMMPELEHLLGANFADAPPLGAALALEAPPADV